MIVYLDSTGERMDVALCRLIEGLSRSGAQKLLESGKVLCGGALVRKSDKTVAGSCIEVALSEPEAVELVPQNIPLDIVFEDEDVIVINKPKGLVVHPAPGHWSGTVVNALLYHCKDSLSGINGALRPGIVHRIDKDTSGLLIAAKNDLAHQSLANQLLDHSLSRTYECIAVGNLRQDEGSICAPIGRHPTDRKKMAVVQGGREAVTHYQVLARYPGYTQLQCRLETGRTHQIRVHLSWQNHPILGDLVYGHKKPELGQSSQCLHAKALRFVHPSTGQAMTVTAPLPEYFEQVLKKLRSMT